MGKEKLFVRVDPYDSEQIRRAAEILTEAFIRGLAKEIKADPSKYADKEGDMFEKARELVRKGLV